MIHGSVTKQHLKATPPNAAAWRSAILATAGVCFAIALGSRRFRHFDPALLGYAIGAALAAFAIAYRFSLWAQRPPSRLYLRRGLELFFRPLASKANSTPPPAATLPLPHGVGTLGYNLSRNFVAQEFIRKRGGYRWIMHLCLSGGSTLAFAITFPLVFGWIHFESLASNAEMYRLEVFGLGVRTFHIHSLEAMLVFNALNGAALLVLVGLVMAGFRRWRDPGERATQTFFEDLFPLVLIFAVTVTGLALTVSYKFLEGRGHALWAVVHMLTVVTLLIYIPYGKLFHIFQRICSLSVSRYKEHGRAGAQASCRSCNQEFASQMHVDDLKLVLDQLGFDYRFATVRGRVEYQDICPPCRRRLFALNQGRSLGR